MTNQQAPEALRLAPIANSDGHITNIERNQIARELRRLHAENERLAALVEAHVQSPAEIEHVAGDVSKNGPESNMAQQPAPSAAATCPTCNDQGAVGNILTAEPCPDCTPQPSPTPQALDPADVIAGALQTSRGHAIELMQQAVDADRADRAARAPADPQLLKFYGVTTDAELIAAQARHIERLQAKLPQTPSFAPQQVREG